MRSLWTILLRMLIAASRFCFEIIEIARVDLIFFFQFCKKCGILSRVYVDRARVAIVLSNSSMTSLCQPWLLSLFISRPCDQVLSHSPRNAHTRERACIRSCTPSLPRSIACCAHVGDKICACVGGSVGLPYIRLGVSDGCTKNGCVSYLVNANRMQFLPQDYVERNYLPLTLNALH